MVHTKKKQGLGIPEYHISTCKTWQEHVEDLMTEAVSQAVRL